MWQFQVRHLNITTNVSCYVDYMDGIFEIIYFI